MPLIHRFSRIFTADLHAVLDRLEEPEALLRQAIRDMDDEIETMQQTQRAEHLEVQRIDERLNDLREHIVKLDSELDICFAAEQEDLARSLVRRKLEARRCSEALAKKGQQLSKSLATLEVSIADGQQEVSAMREKLDFAIDAANTRAVNDPLTTGDAIGTDEIEIALLQEKQRRARS